MSNTETDPVEFVCAATDDRGRIRILKAREVPLGGPRAMTVRRTLPHRDRSFVGAWCFVDHYGPRDVAGSGGMDVPPHPHTGLQTVSWLFAGEIEHRDSGGVHAMVRPGEVNLMTSGSGIAHSEVSTTATSVLHGVQLWIVLPEADRKMPRDFQHYAAPAIIVETGITVRVFIGSLIGTSSPITTRTPLLGAEVRLAAGTSWTIPVDSTFEHAILIDEGHVRFRDDHVERYDLAIIDAGREVLTIEALADTRLLLLGGKPSDEQIVMWWNFIGRDHDQIVKFREEWQSHAPRFGDVSGYRGKTARLPAPPLPHGQLKPRRRTT